MKLNEFPIIQKRYIQLLRVIQCIHIFLAYLAIKQSFSWSAPLNILGIPLLLELMMIVGMQLLITQVKKGRVSLAVGIHQSVTMFFLIMVALLSDGLASTAIIVFPISLLILSIYTSQKYYLVYFLIVFTIVLSIGLNDYFGWFEITQNQGNYRSSRALRLLIIYAYTGFLAWTLMRDLKNAYKDKVRERELIEDAKTKIQQLADTDQLTGLLNRYGANNKFDTLLKNTNFSHSSVMVMFIDIDDFKSINDLYGHHIGDEVLTLISQRIEKVAGEQALISRLGGDEFVVALIKDSAFEEKTYLDKMMTKIAAPVLVDGISIKVTSSIGIAMLDHAKSTLEDISRKADIAMYQAKVDGKNDYCYYRDDLEQAYMANLKLLQGMQEAFDKNGLALHYQQKIDTKTNKVVGAEALLRWEKYNPMDYTARQIIPVLETTNLIHEVGYWTIQKACEDCKVWCDISSNLAVSVNISTRQLTDPSFAINVKKILQDVGLAPSLLMLEVSEDAFTQEDINVIPVLNQIKSYGVKIAIDCFGVGHSNLAYLADLGVDEIKMDQGFTRKLASSEKARSIVTAFAKMTNQLGIQLVAMGVENEEDNRTLLSLGCRIGQGFLWKKAVPADEFSQSASL